MTMQQNFEIPSALRDFAEKGVEQNRAAATSLIQTARKAALAAQQQTGTADLPASHAYIRGLDLAERNVSAVSDAALRMMRAGSIADVFQIQADFVRGQFAAAQDQIRELTDAARPSKAG